MSNKIFIVNMIMSSPNHLDESEELDEMTTKLRYTFNKKARNDISRIRSQYRRPVYDSTLNFHSLHICQESQVQEIQVSMMEAHQDLYNLDPRLYAMVHFIPLDMASIEQGEMYEQIISTIKLQVFDEILKKIDTEELTNAKVLPDRTKKAVLSMIDRLKAINVLNDDNISSKLATIRGKILNNDLTAIREELKKEVTNLTISRASFLEF